MAKYEFTFLLSSNEEIKTVKDLIISQKGKIEKEEELGRRTLSYPIKKYSFAFYFHWIVDVKENQINELRKKFNFSGKLIRYLLLKED